MFDFNRMKERAIVDIFFIGDVSVDMFAGLESKSDLIFKISHSRKGSSVEDSRFQISLVEGLEFQTTLRWRKEIMKDILMYAQWFSDKYNIDNIDMDLKSAATIDILQDFTKRSIMMLTLKSLDEQISKLENDLYDRVKTAIYFVGKHPLANHQLLTYIEKSLYHIIKNR